MNADNAQGAQREADELTREREDFAARLAIREAAFNALELKGAKLRAELDAAKTRTAELVAELEVSKARSEALQTELAALKDEAAELRSAGKQAQALHTETQARLKAVIATERDRASRLELYVESLLSENTASREEAKLQREAAKLQREEAQYKLADMQRQRDEAERQRKTAAGERIAALEQALGRERDALSASEAKCRELQNASDGYLARIEALNLQRKISG